MLLTQLSWLIEMLNAGVRRFLRDTGARVPLVCGPMYPGSNPELVAAVSDAGGFGAQLELHVGRDEHLEVTRFLADFYLGHSEPGESVVGEEDDCPFDILVIEILVVDLDVRAK